MGVVGLCEVDLEDVNTKRLSLRIQLAQLMKERSLLLVTCRLNGVFVEDGNDC